MSLWRRLGTAFLAGCLVLSSTPLAAKTDSLDDVVPKVPGVDLENVNEQGPQPRALTDLFREKAKQAAAAPARLKALLPKRVRSYFGGNPDLNQPLPKDQIEKLVEDADYVAQKMEEDDTTGQFRNFIGDNLNPFIRSLRPTQIVSTITTKGASIGDWTLQSLVVSRMLNYISGSKDFSKRALGLITGRHLKYATHAGYLLVLLSAGFYYAPNITTVVSMFVVLTFWDAFKAGPIGSILSAGSGWFVRPTSEQFKVLESRYTYKWEQYINNFFDRLNPKSDPLRDAEESANDRNDRVKIATLEKDNMDFAGESPEDQIANWEDGKDMFVVVAKRFGQLLRDTHHAGRDLMMLSWTDQQNITQLVETMDIKKIVIRGEANEILNLFKQGFLNQGHPERKEALERAFAEFEAHCNRVWQEPDMSESDQAALAEDIIRSRDKLKEFGLSSGYPSADIDRLMVIQQERARAVGTMVTTLAIGEMRAFYGAERNRNLAEPARKIERAIRSGFDNQYYVNQNLTNVQRALRSMGHRVSGRNRAAPLPAGLSSDECMVIQLRRGYQMPAVTTSSSVMCSKLLWSKVERANVDIPQGSPLSELLQRIQDSTKRNEAIHIVNEAFSMRSRAIDLQGGAKFALEHCVH